MAKVDYIRDEYNTYIGSWEKCSDCYEGQEAIKSKGDVYLPRLSGQITTGSQYATADDRDKGLLQTDDEYDIYKSRAIYYNYLKKITDGLNEQLFRKNVKIEVPTEMQEVIDKFTYEGKSLRTAIKESNKDIFLNYRSVLMLDVPKIEEEIKTVADKERLNIRPYGVYYNAKDIVNWRYKLINNQLKLSLVVIAETIEEYEEDEFEPKLITQYRVLDLDEGSTYRVRLYRKENEEAEFELYEEPTYPTINGKKLDFIPCFFLTKKGISPDLDYPLMNDVADLNIGHYINSADYENSLNITGSPTPVVCGLEEDPDTEFELSLGPNRVLLLSADGQAFFMEYQGQGPDAIANAMDKKVDALSVIAGRMLQNDPKGIESAETASIHRAGEQGQLASMATSLAEAYEYILNIMASWMGISGEITVQFNTDYNPKSIDPQLLGNLNDAKQAGLISLDTYFYNLQKGEMIPEGKTLEEEKEEIDQEAGAIVNLNAGFEEILPEETE